MTWREHNFTLFGGRAFSQEKENKLMPYKDPERKRQWEQEHREEPFPCTL
jgi:hypothetical protein